MHKHFSKYSHRTTQKMLRASLALYVRPAIGNTIRAYRKDNRTRKYDRGAQAGVRHQYEVIKDVKAFEADPEGDFDANFFQVHKSHRQHEEEMKLRKEQDKFYTIRHKYFKSPKSPNMLTWAEKEHIRNLHKEDPDEWSAERLSESFPATQDVIVKVMTGTWTPYDMKAVERHDKIVKRNWEMFKANQLDSVTPELREHLMKFSSRSFDTKENAYIKASVDQVEFQFPKPQSTEFSNIVTSLENAKEKLEQKSIGSDKRTERLTSNEPSLLESKHQLKQVSQFRMSKTNRTRAMTYDELMKCSTKKEPKPEHLSIELTKSVKSESVEELAEANDRECADVVDNTDKPTDLITTDAKHLSTNKRLNLKTAQPKTLDGIQKYESKNVSLDKYVDSNDMVARQIDRIRIPKELRKEGQIYQQYDSFYNHNGHFLYRVPGLQAEDD